MRVGGFRGWGLGFRVEGLWFRLPSRERLAMSRELGPGVAGREHAAAPVGRERAAAAGGRALEAVSEERDLATAPAGRAVVGAPGGRERAAGGRGLEAVSEGRGLGTAPAGRAVAAVRVRRARAAALAGRALHVAFVGRALATAPAETELGKRKGVTELAGPPVHRAPPRHYFLPRPPPSCPFPPIRITPAPFLTNTACRPAPPLAPSGRLHRQGSSIPPCRHCGSNPPHRH